MSKNSQPKDESQELQLKLQILPELCQEHTVKLRRKSAEEVIYLLEEKLPKM